MISFIIPAHNEERALPATVCAIQRSAAELNLPFEIIVVDDASTDRTARVAREMGANVLAVQHRQIAKTRNSGARAAKGEVLFFVDADTTANPGVIAAALRAIDKGAVGGGATVWFDEPLPLYIRVLSPFVGVISKALGFTGGAFLFCRRDAFEKTAGFDERLFCGEEGSFAIAMKRLGRFVIVWERVHTSGRRVRQMTGLQILAIGVRVTFRPVKTVTQRASVEKIWYDSNRANDHEMQNSPAAKISNGIAFIFIVIMLSAPLWNFVPWSMTPLDTPVGKTRAVIRTIIAHTLLVCWPVTAVLIYNLFRQRFSVETLKLAAVTLFCGWQAWGAARGVARDWKLVYQALLG